jgi:hypothetical protein
VHNGSWSAQTSLGGTIIGAPAATVAGGSTVVVAARGTDNALWVRTLSNGAWGPWRSWGGTMSASPAIAGASTGRIDAFSRGPNGALWTHDHVVQRRLDRMDWAGRQRHHRAGGGLSGSGQH